MRYDPKTFKDSRVRAGLTQAQLAVMAGVSVATVSNFETGLRKNPRLEVLQKIANALGVDVGIFFGVTSYENKEATA